MPVELDGTRNGQYPISPVELGTSSDNHLCGTDRNHSIAESIPEVYDPNNAHRSSVAPLSAAENLNRSNMHDARYSDSRAEALSPIARRTTETPTLISQSSSSEEPNRLQQHRLQLNGDTQGLIPRNLVQSPSLEHSPPLAEKSYKHPWWDKPYLRWANPNRRTWFFTLAPLSLCLLVALIVVLVLWLQDKHNTSSTSEIQLTGVTMTQSKALPRSDSSLGATTIVLGPYSGSGASLNPEIMAVYVTGTGRLCVRKKSEGSWLSNVQCVEGTDTKPDTPVTILDWIGGPSIYFLTQQNTLSGIDFSPLNSTWEISSLAKSKQVAHASSQLASVTWLNGTSAWLYYQDTASQLSEFGIDDYRNTAWRVGSNGPLGPIQPGSGIGISRYFTTSSSETMEVFIQSTNGAIHGRLYSDEVWSPDFYAIDYTSGSVTQGAALTAAAVNAANGTSVMLTYVDSSGFLAVQSRGTELGPGNGTDAYGAFAAPKRLLEGDGFVETGVVALGVDGDAKVLFVSGQKVLEVSAGDGVAGNWTSVDVTAV